MFINFWYPAEESKNLTDKPLKVQMLGLHFALWDREAVRRQRGRVAYSIPSPARREHPSHTGQGWAVTAAPVVRPSGIERRRLPTGG